MQAFISFTFQNISILTMLIFLVLILCSALISGSETALFSLSPTDIAKIRDNEDSRVDKTIIELLLLPDSLLATVLIINNLVNICIVVLANNIIDTVVVFPPDSGTLIFVVKVIIVTFLLLLFGEIMPKIFASYNPLGFSRLMAIPLRALKKILSPFSRLLLSTGNRINSSISKRHSDTNISIDVLSDALQITKNQSEEEKQMLSGIVSIVNTEVKDIMKSRIDIVALDSEDNYLNVKKLIIESGFSRIPVYEQALDSIKGVLYVKDLLAHIEKSDDFQWQKCIRTAYFVPEHKKINDLLDEFQSNKVHLAIVVDEYGSTVGLVSMEDILEEVVGEISDESDKDEPSCYEKVDEKTYIFEGKTHLSDFEKIMSLDEDFFGAERDNAETIAGLLLELKRDFVVAQDSFTVGNKLKLTPFKIEGRRIDKVKVVVL